MTIKKANTNWYNCPAEKKSDLIHNYVMRYADRNTRKIDYGTDIKYTSVEMHILEKIAENPGITITELSKLCYRTKGAISQIATRLHEKNLIEKIYLDSGLRQCELYATDDGVKLNKLHLEYDKRNTEEFFNTVKEFCTEEQINSFFEVMETCFLLLSPEENYPWNTRKD